MRLYLDICYIPIIYIQLVVPHFLTLAILYFWKFRFVHDSLETPKIPQVATFQICEIFTLNCTPCPPILSQIFGKNAGICEQIPYFCHTQALGPLYFWLNLNILFRKSSPPPGQEQARLGSPFIFVQATNKNVLTYARAR